MANKLSIPQPKTIYPSTTLPDDQEKLHSTLEERIYGIIGTELLEKNFKPNAYAQAVLQSTGDEHQIIYNYARIRYKELYATASRRLKHSKELKG